MTRLRRIIRRGRVRLARWICPGGALVMDMGPVLDGFRVLAEARMEHVVESMNLAAAMVEEER